MRPSSIKRILSSAVVWALMGPAFVLAATPTQTTLSVSPATYQGTHVYLTATVTADGKPVTRGIVNFCNGAAVHCSDVNVLATAAITADGAAHLTLLPAAGTHLYKAVFQSTKQYAASSSAVETLTLQGKDKTVTRFYTQDGGKTLGATVTSFGNEPPTGVVNFLDYTAGNLTAASATLGNPLSSFDQRKQIQGPPIPSSVQTVVADVNNDGIPDVVTLGDRLQVSLGLNNQLFSTSATFGATRQYAYYALGDLNADGNPDIVLESSVKPLVLQTLFGNGDGTFRVGPTTQIGTGDKAGPIAIADVDGDGILDVIETLTDYTGYSGAGLSRLTIELGQGDGSFHSAFTTYLDQGFDSYHNSLLQTDISLQVADINGDGLPDLIWVLSGVSQQEFVSFPYAVYSLINQGDGTLLGPEEGSEVACYEGSPCTGDGSYTNYSNPIQVADFNGDGKADIAFGAPPDSYEFAEQVYAIGFGDGEGHFFDAGGENIVMPVPATLSLIQPLIYDVNGDGIPDVVGNYVYLGNRDGSFTPDPSIPQLIPTPRAIADFNFDGLFDILPASGIAVDFQSSYAGAQAKNVTIQGSGTHYIYASKPGDAEHIGSASTALPVQASK